MNDLCIVSIEDMEKIIYNSTKKAVEDAFMEHSEQATELDDSYTVKELALKWKMSPQSIWRHVKLGHITPIHIGGRVLFPKEEINRIGNLKYTRMSDNSSAVIK